MNDFTLTANGNIRGAIISENRLDTVATVVDSSISGTATITYDGTAARTGGNTITAKWALQLGTFREVEGR